MIVDQVNFNGPEVAKMTREEFISSHIGLFWLDRDESTRRKMLGDVYDRFVKPKPKKKADK